MCGRGGQLCDEVVEAFKSTGYCWLDCWYFSKAVHYFLVLSHVVGLTYLFLKWQSFTYLLILWQGFQLMYKVYRDSDMLMSIVPKLSKKYHGGVHRASEAEGCTVHFAYLSHLCLHVLC